jgi:poly-beta-1,6-N-acetyl-D-glucosamine synthase
MTPSLCRIFWTVYAWHRYEPSLEMMQSEVIIFCTAAAFLSYTYAGYPALLRIMRKERARKHDATGFPMVSVIIPFHNEERWVAAKLDNTFAWNYPAGRLEIIAVSDGSTDGTSDVLSRFDGRVRTIAYPCRHGKPTALNRGVAEAIGDVLILTDANVLVHPDAVKAMVEHYADPQVGGVSGNVALQPEGVEEPLGEGFYMRYERWLYEQESRAGTMVGADGALFSVRRQLFVPLPGDSIADDFEVALGVIEQGRRIRYEPRAWGVEVVAADVKAEFRRKVRMIAGGYQALWRHRSLLHPVRRPALALRLISHKLLRWLVPVFLLAALAAPFAAPPSSWLMTAAAIQAVFYGLAACGWISRGLRQWLPVYLPYYFCAVNVAAAMGLWRYVRGSQPITWQKAR